MKRTDLKPPVLDSTHYTRPLEGLVQGLHGQEEKPKSLTPQQIRPLDLYTLANCVKYQLYEVQLYVC